MKTTFTNNMKKLVFESARTHFRKEISAISEVQRYARLLELILDKKETEELYNKFKSEQGITAEKIITEIKLKIATMRIQVFFEDEAEFGLHVNSEASDEQIREKISSIIDEWDYCKITTGKRAGQTINNTHEKK